MVNILFIPDGSRRAARKTGISYSEAYRLAAEKVDTAIRFLLGREEVSNLVVYGLSYDNLVERDRSELDSILKAQEGQYRKWLNDPFFVSKMIRVVFHGDVNLFFEYLPPSYIKVMQELEDATKGHEWKKLFILIGHSWRKEARRSRLGHNLGYAREIGRPAPPDIDLVIRTGGATRLSDALLNQTAYAELHVVDKLITEIEISDLSKALDTLRATVRNFGR